MLDLCATVPVEWRCTDSRPKVAAGNSMSTRRKYMAILSRTTLSTMLAAAMLAGSSFAFAADNKNSDNQNSVGNEQTGSIRDNAGADTPDQADIERCKMAVADDPTCVGVPKQ